MSNRDKKKQEEIHYAYIKAMCASIVNNMSNEEGNK